MLKNSAAVIIVGAILNSPLINPILSSTLELLLGDGKNRKRAATVLVISIAAGIGTAWLPPATVQYKWKVATADSCEPEVDSKAERSQRDPVDVDGYAIVSPKEIVAACR